MQHLIYIPPILEKIAKALAQKGAKSVIVGGSVRDYFLGKEIKDYDIEVFGLTTLEELEETLLGYGKVKLVGKSFGVLKFVHEGMEYDFSFPRKEQKVGLGHCGFEVQVDGTMAFEEAARRRDFTINAMGYEIGTKKLLDPFGGEADLKKGLLRHVESKTFVEDPLRLYRGVQFCARFSLKMPKETKRLCQKMVDEGMLLELPKERVFEEMKKLLLKSPKPSVGFALLQELGALHPFPPLFRLSTKEELYATMQRSLDRGVTLFPKQERVRLEMLLALIVYAVMRVSLQEEQKVALAESFIAMLSEDKRLKRESIALAMSLERVPRLYKEKISVAKKIKELALDVEIAQVVMVAEAWYAASNDQEGIMAAKWLFQEAKRLGVLHKPMAPLLQGKDLLRLGLKPSPKFKEILDKVYQMQLEGLVKSEKEALAYVKKEFI